LTKNLPIWNLRQVYIFGVPVDEVPTSLSAVAPTKEPELRLSDLKFLKRKKSGYATANTHRTSLIVTGRTKRSDFYINGLK
jgi:hypothetical protein